MIYIDTSVALAQLLAEDVVPPDTLWEETLVSSRLLEYELWNRVHARGLSSARRPDIEAFLARLAFLELAPQVLSRALEPFPKAVRTLDALHLASLDFLTKQRQTVSLATYDSRQRDVARLMGIALFTL